MRMNYQSRKYALLNSPIEVDRHLMRVRTFLAPRPTDRILEVGCGRGFLTRHVQSIASDTTGIDLNAQAIANAVATDLRVMDACRLEFDDQTFDQIYSFHAIEHIPDLSRALREMDRVLKPGGRILLVYPAEPIRGLYVVPTAMLLFGNPFRARDLHVHRLTPPAVYRFAAGTSLRPGSSRLELLLTPQFLTILEKIPASTPAPWLADEPELVGRA